MERFIYRLLNRLSIISTIFLLVATTEDVMNLSKSGLLIMSFGLFVMTYNQLQIKKSVSRSRKYTQRHIESRQLYHDLIFYLK